MDMIQLIGLVMVYTGFQYPYSKRIAKAFVNLAYPTENKAAGQVLPVTEEDQDILLIIGILVKGRELFIRNGQFYKNDPVMTYEDLKNLHKGD